MGAFDKTRPPVRKILSFSVKYVYPLKSFVFPGIVPDFLVILVCPRSEVSCN